MADPSVALRAWPDPAVVFAALEARSADVFWLDAGPDAVSGWSWVGVGEPAAEADVRAIRCDATAPLEGSPLQRGWVGWTGYEGGAARAGATVADPDAGIPPAAWLRVTRFVSFDHATRTARAHGAGAAALAALAALPATGPDASAPGAPASARPARGRHTPEYYAALIGRCRDAIEAGDAYQLCLTTRFDLDGDVDAVAAFTALRRATPSHHGGFLRIGGVALVSASPEQFLAAAGGVVRTKPIKGTRPRSPDAGTDAALAAELRADEKERAENVMIVDLMRNDLSRVCEPATVAVERLLEVESYPAVHQLVSTVAGRLRSGTTVGGLLDATFPAGSMTGAPKLSAMGILHALEGGPRGVFAGCFGWVDERGGLDLAMVIRSIVVHPGGAYVGAGGGITWRSEPAAEVAEVGLKARAPLAALGAVLPRGWGDSPVG